MYSSGPRAEDEGDAAVRRSVVGVACSAGLDRRDLSEPAGGDGQRSFPGKFLHQHHPRGDHRELAVLQEQPLDRRSHLVARDAECASVLLNAGQVAKCIATVLYAAIAASIFAIDHAAFSEGPRNFLRAARSTSSRRIRVAATVNSGRQPRIPGCQPGPATFVMPGYCATTTPSAFLPMRSIAFCAKPEAFMSATKALAYSITGVGEPFG